MMKKTGSIIGELMKKRAAAEAGQESSEPDPSKNVTVVTGAPAPGAKVSPPASGVSAPLRAIEPALAPPAPISVPTKPAEPPKAKKSYAITQSHVEDIERLAWLWNTSASQVVDQALGEFVAKRARELASAADLRQTADQRRTA